MHPSRTPWTEQNGKEGSTPATRCRVGEKQVEEGEFEITSNQSFCRVGPRRENGLLKGVR